MEVASVAGFVDPNEAMALANYAGDHGLDPLGDFAAKIHDAIAARHTAVNSDAWLKANGDLVRAYAQLAAVTSKNNVTGRTVIDSHEFHPKHTFAEWVFGIVCIFGAIGTEILSVHYGIERSSDLAVTGASLKDPYYTFYTTTLLYLLPFFWGGVGSFLYIIKHLSERAAARQFSSIRLRGSIPRLVLGSVFGGVVAHLYGEQANAVVAFAVPDLSATGSLGASALAFVSGLGVKAVYGAFQAVIQTVTIWVDDLVPKRPAAEEAQIPVAVQPTQPVADDSGEAAQEQANQEKEPKP